MTNRIKDLKHRKKAKPSANGHAANGKARGNGRAKQPPAPLGAVGDGGKAALEDVFWEAALDASKSICVSEGGTGAPETVAPSAPAGKDAKTGQFTSGNSYGRGNPHARQQAAFHKALLDAVTPHGVQSLAISLWTQAKGGDVTAAALLLSYLIGRPRTAHDPDRLDLDELRRARCGAAKK